MLLVVFQMKLVVFRPEQQSFTIIEVDLLKKAGKGLGLSVIALKSGKGVYVFEIVSLPFLFNFLLTFCTFYVIYYPFYCLIQISGGIADTDGKIMKGDMLISVNGQNVENSSAEEAGAILKTAVGKISLKLRRYKPVVR